MDMQIGAGYVHVECCLGSIAQVASIEVLAKLTNYFYPADFTPICTSEACSIRDMHDDILDVDIRVVGVSPQTSESHAKFKSSFDLPFPLLFDQQKKVIKAYGADGLLGLGVRRATFLISESKVIEGRVVSDVFVSSHVKFIKEVIAQRAAG